jgi:hypothetical protein
MSSSNKIVRIPFLYLLNRKDTIPVIKQFSASISILLRDVVTEKNVNLLMGDKSFVFLITMKC